MYGQVRDMALDHLRSLVVGRGSPKAGGTVAGNLAVKDQIYQCFEYATLDFDSPVDSLPGRFVQLQGPFPHPMHPPARQPALGRRNRLDLSRQNESLMPIWLGVVSAVAASSAMSTHLGEQPRIACASNSDQGASLLHSQVNPAKEPDSRYEAAS